MCDILSQPFCFVNIFFSFFVFFALQNSKVFVILAKY